MPVYREGTYISKCTYCDGITNYNYVETKPKGDTCQLEPKHHAE